jgi:hypothetical protein
VVGAAFRGGAAAFLVGAEVGLLLVVDRGAGRALARLARLLLFAALLGAAAESAAVPGGAAEAGWVSAAGAFCDTVSALA